MSGTRRVVVTGIGLITPVGLDVDSTWKNLLAGTPGIDSIKGFDTTNQQVKIAGELKDFDPKQFMDHKMARRSGRFPWRTPGLAAFRRAMRAPSRLPRTGGARSCQWRGSPRGPRRRARSRWATC